MSASTNPTFKLLNVTAASEQLGVSVSYLNKLRLYGGGPRFLKFGTRVLYNPEDLVAWMVHRTRESTSGVAAQGSPT